jgi:hypothetical protein
MAVATAVAAVAGIGMAVYGAIEADKDQKKAEQAARKAAASLKGVKEENAFESLQAPDIQGLAAGEIGQGQAAATEALGSMGQEGAAQIVHLEKNARDSNLKAAGQQAGINYNRDVTVATGTQGVNEREAAAERAIHLAELTGSQLAARDAEERKQANIESGFSSAGDLAGEFDSLLGDDTVKK